MNFRDFRQYFSASRVNRYLLATGNSNNKAVRLYAANLKVAQAFPRSSQASLPPSVHAGRNCISRSNQHFVSAVILNFIGHFSSGYFFKHFGIHIGYVFPVVKVVNFSDVVFYKFGSPGV